MLIVLTHVLSEFFCVRTCFCHFANSIQTNFPGTNFTWKATQGNSTNSQQEDELQQNTHTDNANPGSHEHLESIYAIEYYDPSVKVTDEILTQFNSEEDAEFEGIVAV